MGLKGGIPERPIEAVERGRQLGGRGAGRRDRRRGNGRGDEPVPSHLVLNHSPRSKEDALTKYEEKKKEWEARAAERRALEAPWGPPPRKKRRRKPKKEEL